MHEGKTVGRAKKVSQEISTVSRSCWLEKLSLLASLKTSFSSSQVDNPCPSSPRLTPEEINRRPRNWATLPTLSFLFRESPQDESSQPAIAPAYVSDFPKETGFHPGSFPPLSALPKQASFWLLPWSASSFFRPKPESRIPRTQGRRLRVSACCVYPLGRFQLYPLPRPSQAEKMKKRGAHRMCKSGFSTEKRAGFRSRGCDHKLSTEFSTPSRQTFF